MLVRDWAVVLPARSSKLEIESSSSGTTITPGETVYGSLKRYFSSRSGLIETWLRDDVEAAGLEPGEDRVPLRLLERDLEAELVGDGLGDLDVEADEVAGLVVEAEGAVGALGRDGQRAGLRRGRARRPRRRTRGGAVPLLQADSARAAEAARTMAAKAVRRDMGVELL